MKSIFFVHVPKTAGTSFRTAAEKYFGAKYIYSDYGGHSGVTSEDVQKLVYQEPDIYKLHNRIRRKKIKLLTGHVRVDKYNPVFSCLSITSFMRHPVEQVISHFEHYVRHLGYESSFDDFIREERFTNLQTRLLGNLPLELYGFLGLTDRYNESLDLFNDFYGAGLEKLSLNTKSGAKNHRPQFGSIAELDQKKYDFIARRNGDDMMRYDIAKKIFEKRLSMQQQGLPYTFGFVRGLNRRRVAGLAFGKNPETPSRLEIVLNGEVVAEVSATEPRSNMMSLNIPRNAYVGFSHTFAKPIDEDDEVLCRVKQTGQVMYGETRIRSEA